MLVTLDQLQKMADTMDIAVGQLLDFSRLCEAGLSEDRDHAAFYRLLGDMVQRFVERYEGMPLHQADAVKAQGELRRLTKMAAEAAKGSAEDRLRAATTIARSEL